MAKKASKKTSKAAPKAAPATKKERVQLLEVKPNRSLFWPRPTAPLRGGPGTVVPSDDPLIFGEDALAGYADQSHKLSPISVEDAEKRWGPGGITPVADLQAVRKYQQLGYTRIPLELPSRNEPPPEEVREAAKKRGTEGHADIEVPKIDDAAEVMRAADEAEAAEKRAREELAELEGQG